jgi:hypothetical protein
MAAKRKLQRGIEEGRGSPLRAVLVGQFEIAWLDRGDTTNGSYEPEMTDAASWSNVRSREFFYWIAAHWRGTIFQCLTLCLLQRCDTTL